MNKARHLWFSCFTIALLLVSSLAGTATNAAPTEAPWSPAVRLEGSSLPTLFPEIAADTQGGLHAVFEEASSDLTTRRIMYTNNIGGSFKTPVHISTVSGSTVSGNPKLAIRGNRIDVIFHSRSGGLLNGRLYYTTSADRGATWTTTPVNLSGAIPAFDAAITIDAVNGSHVVYGGYTGGETYAVFYTTKPDGGTWSAPTIIAERVPGNSYNNYPDIISTFANNTVALHVFYMGNTIPGQELNKSVYSLRKVGSAPWSASVLRGGSGANYPKLATDGNNTLWATWQGFGGNFETYQSKSVDNGVTWSTPTNRSNNSGLSGRPDVALASNGAVMLAWDDSQGDSDAKQDIWSAFSPDGTNWQGPVRIFSAPGFSKETEVTGSCDAFHTVWHDAGTGDNKLHILFSQTGVAKSCSSVVPVDFTPTRTSASPTTNPTIQVSLDNLAGSPDQMRFSLTPFAAGDATLAWTALTSTFSVNATNVANCSATVYIQLKNSTNGQVSTVKTVTAVIDTAVQAGVTIQTMEDAANRTSAPTVEQPNAPAVGHPDFTRKSTYSYMVGQEPSSCSGTDKHAAGGTTFDPPAYPYSGIGQYIMDESADSSGVGFEEQIVQATVHVTDTLVNNTSFTKQFRYDDDPPVLAISGTAAMVGSNPTNQALVTVAFTATVTDDSYGAFINQPNAAFWGVWVLATNTNTAPTPAQFEQYGSAYSLMPGSTSIKNVLLINGLVNGAGPRYVHIRFLDGAGNYTETVLTSAEITLQDPIQKPRVLLPYLSK